MGRMYPSFGTNVPPNTPNRAKRRMVVTFDFKKIGGAKEALQWQGDDTVARAKLKRPPTPPEFIMKVRTADIPNPYSFGSPSSQFNEPDHSTYNPSWANTIPNRGQRTFTMKDTILLPGLLPPSRKSDRSSSPKRLPPYSMSPIKLNQYSDVPYELERQKSNIFSHQVIPSRRPGIIDTIGAADRAIRHIQVKNERQDKAYDNIIDFHHNRAEDAYASNPIFKDGLSRSKEMSTSDSDLAIDRNKQWDKMNWKSTLSRTYKEEYMDILQTYQYENKNRIKNSNVVSEFYKTNENALATKMDLRRFHHAI